VKRVTLLLLSILLASAALAAVTVTNVTEWYVRAVAPPVWKLGNASFSPLLGGWWGPLGGLNVTYYRLRFVPGWREEYVVGRVVNSSPAVAHFEKVSEAGSGTYSIYLGGRLQLSNSQGGGPDVPLPAGILWSSTASGRYSVSAWLVFRSGATARQLVNFTAEPMSLLYSASRACAFRSFSDDFSGACVRVQYSFSTSVPNNRTYVSGRGSVGLDSIHWATPPPPLHIVANGYASFFIDYSSSPFSASTSFAFQYMFKFVTGFRLYGGQLLHRHERGRLSRLEVIYYGSGRGEPPESMASVIYGRSLPTVSRPAPGFTNRQNIWYTVSISQVYTTGVVVGVAFTAYSLRNR